MRSLLAMLALVALAPRPGLAAPRTASRKATMTLLDPSAPVDQRIAAARSLGKSGDQRAALTLIKVLETREEELQDAAVAALRGLAPVAFLVGQVASADAATEDRMLAARGLGVLRAREGVPALIAALRAPPPELRAEAALALAVLGAAEAGDPLLQVLKSDQDAHVRAQAANALGDIRTPGIKAGLEAQLKVEKAPSVRYMLKSALRRHAAAP